MQKIRLNGDGECAVATPDGRNRKKKKIHRDLPVSYEDVVYGERCLYMRCRHGQERRS